MAGLYRNRQGRRIGLSLNDSTQMRRVCPPQLCLSADEAAPNGAEAAEELLLPWAEVFLPIAWQNRIDVVLGYRSSRN